MVLKHPSLRQPRQMMVYSDVDGTLVSDSNELHATVVKQIER
ncbi:MAG: hypothetical protein JWN30_1115, partial [Bacilli bacterium]|nr:hypothetical protein [Bacilli bacterium]